MTLKFLHTADWQMGLKALQAGEKAKEVRAARYETAGRVAELAKREGVDFAIIAGDLFEHHDIDEGVVRRTVDALDKFAPVPVYVLPGNHDPLVMGGIWARQSWKRVGSHVKLLDKAAEVAIGEDVCLFPCPLSQKQSSMDPTSWAPSRGSSDDRILIGVAHGSLDVLPEKGNFPISSTRAAEAGWNYLALGDWHGFVQHGRTVYSGTMEQTSFTEKDPGNVAIVEIPSPEGDPIVTKVRVGRFQWSEHGPSIRDLTDVVKFRTAIRDAGPLATRLLRIVPQLDPATSPEVVRELVTTRQELSEEAFLLDWPEESLNAILQNDVLLPDGTFSRVDADLASILEGKVPEGEGRQAASADRKVVEEARRLLRTIAREVQK